MCSDEERVWWKCDTLYFGSLAIDDGSCDGLRGRVDFAVVMKCEEGHERSRSLPYGKEIRLGVKGLWALKSRCSSKIWRGTLKVIRASELVGSIARWHAKIWDD